MKAILFAGVACSSCGRSMQPDEFVSDGGSAMPLWSRMPTPRVIVCIYPHCPEYGKRYAMPEIELKAVD